MLAVKMSTDVNLINKTSLGSILFKSVKGS